MLALRFSPRQSVENEVTGLRDRFDQMLGDLRAASRPFASAAFPALNVWEDQDHYFVEAELPGIKMADLEILVADRRTLTIKGQRTPEQCEHGTWHRRERGCGAFERELPLPGYVDADKVEAGLKQGVLTVKLPKSPEMKPRKIEVKAS